MTRYVLRRLSYSVFVLLAIVSVIFILMHLIGDPVALMFPVDVPQELLDAKRAQLGFADPLLDQYLRFMSHAVRGEFGTSLWQGIPAEELVRQRLLGTLGLTALTIVLAVSVGVILGVVAAYKERSLIDRAVTVLSMVSIAIPEFWFALVLIVVFAVQLHLLPTSGYGRWENVVLPVATLAVRPFGRVAQMTRASMSDQLYANYVVTARAKGMSPSGVAFGHMFRNAAIAIITLVGDEVVGLVSGAIIVETVFAWPGLGQLLIQAIQRRDLPLVEAAVATIGVMVVAINLVVDLSYGMLDPRIRYA